MTTALASVKNSSECRPPSRPIPESFMPPNGARRSRMKKQFTHMVPVRTSRATWFAVSRLVVQIMPARP